MPGTYLRPLLVIVADETARAVRRHAFLRSPVRVGRDPACELVLDAPFVSGRHGLLQFDDADVWYSDLGSRNGTALDGAALDAGAPAALGVGSTLRVGTLRITVERGVLPTREEETIPPGRVTALLREVARTPDLDASDAWAASLRPGLVVGRFELVRELGRGGFGVVFEARDRRLGRLVAFKAVRPGGGLETGPGDEWLVHEAEAAAQLNHPHIVQLYDAGTWEGGPYLIYELLRGESLAQRLERGPLPPAEVVQVSIEVARALAHAHAGGVVHRDLKPSNVFLTGEGTGKVLDFGLAQVLGAARREGGTPQYMAPEQERGADQDARVDVFAAAVVLQEAWLGPGPDPGRVRRPEPLPGAPAELDELLARALDPQPARRPADGGAWLTALLRVQRGLERQASAPGDGKSSQ